MALLSDYSALKHGLVGLTKTFAIELAEHSIRVNSLHPTGVNTPRIANDNLAKVVEARPDLVEHMQNLLPVDAVEPEDISAAVLFLASDAGRFVTGASLPVDAGTMIR